MSALPTYSSPLVEAQGVHAYSRACANRLLDRPNCDWPEIAIIGNALDHAGLAAALRRRGIAVATYPGVPVRRQSKRAISDGADYLLFADEQKMRCRITRDEWRLADPVESCVFAVNAGYIPNEAYWGIGFDG